MARRNADQGIDDFIAAEMQGMEPKPVNKLGGGLQKPSFGAKKPSFALGSGGKAAYSKPSFGKKASNAGMGNAAFNVEQVDDGGMPRSNSRSNLAQAGASIVDPNAYSTPVKSYSNFDSQTDIKQSSQPGMLSNSTSMGVNSAQHPRMTKPIKIMTKPMKPNMIPRNKFQMPVDQKEQERQNALLKNNPNSSSAASLNVDTKKALQQHKAPKQLISTTKLAAAENRVNPRPPSSQPNALQDGSDGYSDENYEQNDFEDDKDNNQEADRKMEKLREKIKRDNIKAQAYVAQQPRNLNLPSKSKPSIVAPRMTPSTLQRQRSGNRNDTNGNFNLGSQDVYGISQPDLGNQSNQAYQLPPKNLKMMSGGSNQFSQPPLQKASFGGQNPVQNNNQGWGSPTPQQPPYPQQRTGPSSKFQMGGGGGNMQQQNNNNDFAFNEDRAMMSGDQYAPPAAGPNRNDGPQLQGFAQQTVLIQADKIDLEAAGSQEKRAEELRELIQLEQEEFFNVFELVPQTPNDIYYDKLSAGLVKTAIVSTRDELQDMDTQTEALDQQDAQMQAPEDSYVQGTIAMPITEVEGKNTMTTIMAMQKPKITSFSRTKKKENEALALDKFMGRAGPVMEAIIDENEQLFFLQNKARVQKSSSVELKQSLRLPLEMLVLLGDDKGNLATVEKVTAIHMFETVPQAKCAIAYEVNSPRVENDFVHLIVVYSITANQVLRILNAESEVISMCTPADDSLLIVGTVVGSICLFDLSDFEKATVKTDFLNYRALLEEQNPQVLSEKGEERIQKELKDLQGRFTMLTHTYQTDSLANYQHFSPIRRLQFVNKVGSSPAQISAMDELGVISAWSVMEIQAHIAEKMGDHDLNLNIGGRYKLLENFSENLMFMPEVFADQIEDGEDITDITQSMELEFDPTDTNIFYFSTSRALFKCNRRHSPIPVKLETSGLGAPSALSMSDKQYLLAGFTCGSIAMYHDSYRSPVTIWYQACKYPIIHISWCLLHYDDSRSSKEVGNARNFLAEGKFTTRLCEFFAIDRSEDFLIWNLQKKMDKPAHVIHFGERHQSSGQIDLSKISMTCVDQTFFTTFGLMDKSVNMYMMNFKKGSQITKEKLATENKKSLNLLSTLPVVAGNAKDAYHAEQTQQ